MNKLSTHPLHHIYTPLGKLYTAMYLHSKGKTAFGIALTYYTFEDLIARNICTMEDVVADMNWCISVGYVTVTYKYMSKLSANKIKQIKSDVPNIYSWFQQNQRDEIPVYKLTVEGYNFAKSIYGEYEDQSS
jgi:hypothetical protein